MRAFVKGAVDLAEVVEYDLPWAQASQPLALLGRAEIPQHTEPQASSPVPDAEIP